MPDREQGMTRQDEEFVPRGAVAFFLAMVGFYAAVWVTLYWIMAARS